MSGAIGELASRGALLAQKQFQDLRDDPILFLIRATRIVGIILLGAGLLLGVLAYFLKAGATAAVTSLRGIYQQLAQIWSNIQAPSFTPAATGTAPLSASLQGVQNFFSDASADLSAAGSDLSQIGGVIGTLGEDVAMGLVDVGKSIWTIGINFPGILWNGVVAVLGGGLADLLGWAFPYLILFGLISLGISIGLSIVRAGLLALWRDAIAPSWKRAKARWSERLQARISPWVDRFFRNDRHAEPAPDPVPDETTAVAPAAAARVPIARRKPAPDAVGSNTPDQTSHENPGGLSSTSPEVDEHTPRPLPGYDYQGATARARILLEQRAAAPAASS